MAQGHPRRDADLDCVIAHQVPFVITSVGRPDAVVERVHAYGGLVFHDVIDDAFARKAIEKGADGLVAVAAGAGGHAGRLSPFALVQETRHWDEADGRTHSMRSKEGSSDYRYFPEPDLVPVAPTTEMREAVLATMPELPAARRERLQSEWGISDHDARTLLTSEGLADYAEAAVAALGTSGVVGTPKDIVNWCLADAVRIGPIYSQAKDVLAECLSEPKRPKQVVEERGLVQVSDTGELGAAIDALLAANPDDVAAYRAGDDKARKKKRGFFMGELMKATKGQANPQVLNQLLDEKLQG